LIVSTDLAVRAKVSGVSIVYGVAIGLKDRLAWSTGGGPAINS
jgi:hypothetical protein